jgi:hypothetical protein
MAGPSNIFGFGCCADGVPYNCYLTIQFLDCATGDPIVGATVAGYANDSFGRPVVPIGTDVTDASGKYYFGPASSLSAAAGFSIAWEGFTSITYEITITPNHACPPMVLCYCGAKVKVETGNPTAVIDTLAMFPLSGPPVNGAGQFTADPGGNFAFSYQNIDFSLLRRFPLPAALCVYAKNDPYPGGYIPNCASVTVNCGDDTTVSVPMYKYSPDYWGYDISCDHGCNGALAVPGCDSSSGEGPNYRGVLPITLYVTFAPSPAGAFPVFNPYSLAGVPIPVTWDGAKWASGCLPVSSYGASWSARVAISWGAPVSETVSFVLYSDADCTTQISQYLGGVRNCDLTAPVDVVADPSSANYFTITQ